MVSGANSPLFSISRRCASSAPLSKTWSVFPSYLLVMSHHSFSPSAARDSVPSIAASDHDMIYTVILDRLQARNGCSLPESPNDINFLLPDPTSPLPKANLWSRIANASFLVSDAELQVALNLARVSELSQAPKHATDLYIRSYCIRSNELRVILAEMLEANIFNSTSKLTRYTDWLAATKTQERVWIRYAGQTRTTGLKRLLFDLSLPSRSFGMIFIQFLAKDARFCQVIDYASVFTIIDARSTEQKAADLGEQATVALLWSGLLNQQWGGLGSTYNVPIADLETFASFSTSLTENAQSKTSTPFDDDSTMRYVTALQEYHDTNVSSNHTFTNAVRDACRRQLQGLTVSGNATLALMVAAEPTVKSFRDAELFLDGSGDSGRLMMNMLSAMATSEASAKPCDETFKLSTLFRFLDLVPWPSKNEDHLRPLVRLHRNYIESSKPIIVATLSERQAAVFQNALDDDFMSSFRFKSGEAIFEGRRFVELVGTLKICKLSSTSSDQYFINIPCYHPGSMAKMSSENQQLFGKVFFKTLVIIWLTADTVLSLDSAAPTYDFCSQVIQAVHSRLNDAQFIASFVQDRNLLSTAMSHQKQALPFASKAGILGLQNDTTSDVTSINVVKPVAFYKGGQGWISVSNRTDTAQKALRGRAVDDSNSADPMWFFAKFLEECYDCRLDHGERYPTDTITIDLGPPSLVKTSIWLSLHDFCTSSSHREHPYARQIKELCQFDEDAGRHGGKQTASSVTMTAVLKALLPRADAFKEWFYPKDGGKTGKVMVSAVLVPGRNVTFSGFQPGDLSKKGVWLADKRKSMKRQLSKREFDDELGQQAILKRQK